MTLETLTGAELAPRVADLHTPYRSTFSAPPWNEPSPDADRFVERLTGRSTGGSAGGRWRRVPRAGRAIGFLPPGDPTRDQMTTAPVPGGRP